MFFLRTAALAALLMVASACGSSDSTTAPTPVPTPNPGPAPVASVQVTPADAVIDIGATRALVATTRDAQNNVLTGRAVTFASSMCLQGRSGPARSGAPMPRSTPLM